LASGGADCSVRTWDLLSLLDPSYSSDNENNINKVLRPKHTFFTKASPVYKLGYTARNVVYAGGCCSFEAAICKLSFDLYPLQIRTYIYFYK
jgi:hypothetical protein